MTALRDPELERLRTQFLSANQSACFGSVEWPRVAAIVAATRTYLTRRYATDVPNFDALSREPSWVPVDRSVRRPMMGIVASLEEDQRISSLISQNHQKFQTAVLSMVTTLTSIDRFASDESASELPAVKSAVERIRHLLDRFQQVADSLRSRRGDRPALELNDEYDVQFLLGGLLRLDFDDVEPESWTPSYAGGSARIDFLLRQEQTALEIKYASDSLRDKKLREQLIVDCDYYRQHPACKRLVCFVYDRDGYVQNPRGFETGLTEARDGILVTTFVRPLR